MQGRRDHPCSAANITYLLRKWLGVVLVAAGAVGCVVAGQTRVLGFDLGLLSVFAVAIGMGLS